MLAILLRKEITLCLRYLIQAGIGYRFDRWTLRLDGTNLSNSRAPVAESEIGDAQFYRLPGRSVMLSASMSF